LLVILLEWVIIVPPVYWYIDNPEPAGAVIISCLEANASSNRITTLFLFTKTASATV
jgi:hypothetical protein